MQLAPTPASLPEVRAMALWLAAHGTPVFPLTVGGKTPATKEGFKDATTDPDTIARWWAHRPYNVAISTGPARLIVIDLDTPNDAKALPAEWADEPGVVDGADVLAVLAERAGQRFPVDTRIVATPSGGSHLYFTAPTPLPSTAGRLGPMIDTRAMGGYVVAPPSRTAAGAYRTVHPGPIQPLPGWLADALTPPAPPEHAQNTGRAQNNGQAAARAAAAPRGPVGEPYVFAAFENEVDAVLSARPGTRNDTLNRAAYALGQFVAAGRLNQSQVIDALTIAAAHIGLGPTETERTIASGLASAANQPRHPQYDRRHKAAQQAGSPA